MSTYLAKYLFHYRVFAPKHLFSHWLRLLAKWAILHILFYPPLLYIVVDLAWEHTISCVLTNP